MKVNRSRPLLEYKWVFKYYSGFIKAQLQDNKNNISPSCLILELTGAFELFLRYVGQSEVSYNTINPLASKVYFCLFALFFSS